MLPFPGTVRTTSLAVSRPNFWFVIDEILRLIIGVYCKLVMISNILCGVIQIVLSAIVLKVLPIWNPNFVLEIEQALGANADSSANFFTYWNADILQNQFTSFLSFAISNARIDYIRAKIKRLQREQITEQFEILFAEETFQIEDFMENESVSQAIRRIHEKERYVFLSRVVEEKKFKEIAHALNMSEKGVAAIYYRTVKKLRDMLEGGE